MVEHARIGIVDMGSNAIRFMVAEAAGTAHRIVESHRLPVRLGRAVFETGQLPEAAVADTVDAFRRFRATCDRLGVDQTRAIATSAMRDARNRELLVDRVREASGFEIDVISGTHEAYLLKVGIETRVDLSKGRSLLVDVGGGSVEIVVVDDGSVSSANSYRLGALRMLQAFPDAEGEALVDLLKKHLKGLQHRIREHLDGAPIDRYLAVGGNIDSLADLIAAREAGKPDAGKSAVSKPEADIDSCTIKSLRNEVDGLAKMSVEQRIKKFDLRPDRADTILPAGVVYLHLGKLAGTSHVLVPRTGIKEGLLVESVRGGHRKFAAEDHVEVALGSCRALGRRFHFEAHHAEAVLDLSRQLFDQTKKLHGLGKRARVLLDAAALLHDVGVAVNNDGHHKHSKYLIESTELVGLGGYERHLVAMLARYHRKAAPSRDHVDFMALRRRDRAMIERLAAILRIADALDRQHAGVVSEIEVEIADDELRLHPRLREGHDSRLTLEATAVAAKGSLFAALFGLQPRLIAPTTAAPSTES
ncbi:MAG: HD domain-containing protein [Planctomycetota bacterium]